MYSDVPFNVRIDPCIQAYIVFAEWKSSINKLALCKLQRPFESRHVKQFIGFLFGEPFLVIVIVHIIIVCFQCSKKKKAACFSLTLGYLGSTQQGKQCI